MLDVLASVALHAAAPPSFTPQQPPGTGGVTTIMDWLDWGAEFSLIGGLIYTGAIMWWEHHSQKPSSHHIAMLAKIFFGGVLMNAGPSLVLALH